MVGTTHRLEKQFLLVCSAALAAPGVLMATPGSARACSTLAPDPKLDGIPADGDKDVPTDVVPYYLVPLGFGTKDGVFTLTAVASGTGTVLTPQTPDTSGFELRPPQPLAPATDYVLRATWTVSPGRAVVNQVHFTTGTGPLAKMPAQPAGHLTHFTVDPSAVNSCNVANGTCISLAEGDPAFEVAILDASGQVLQLLGVRESFIFDGTLLFPLVTPQGTTSADCVRVRARGLNGTFSDPIMLCGADVPVQQLAAAPTGCTPSGLVIPGVAALPDAGVPQHGNPATGVTNPSGPDASTQKDAGGAPAQSRPFESAQQPSPMQGTDGGASGPPASPLQSSRSPMPENNGLAGSSGCNAVPGSPNERTPWLAAIALAWLSLRARRSRTLARLA